jgi:hypothetical protein
MDRIDRLERSLRRWKVGTLAAVGLAFGAGAAQDSTPQFVTVRELKLVDGQGVVRMVIDPDRGTEGPAIIMYAKTGKVAGRWMTLDNSDCSEISMFDPKTGKENVIVENSAREGRVTLRNRNGKEMQAYAPGSVPF